MARCCLDPYELISPYVYSQANLRASRRRHVSRYYSRSLAAAPTLPHQRCVPFLPQRRHSLDDPCFGYHRMFQYTSHEKRNTSRTAVTTSGVNIVKRLQAYPTYHIDCVRWHLGPLWAAASRALARLPVTFLSAGMLWPRAPTPTRHLQLHMPPCPPSTHTDTNTHT